MTEQTSSFAAKTLLAAGFDQRKAPYAPSLEQEHFDIQDRLFWQIIPKVYDYTQCRLEKLWQLYCAVQYLQQRQISGALVETGVFFGGSFMLSAATCLAQQTPRHLYAFDTFKMFSGPQTADDINYAGQALGGDVADFRQQFMANFATINYPASHSHIIAGAVEDTIPITDTGPIALLRLDTDTFLSYEVALAKLYPRLVAGGIIILDDYGYAQGARKACDAFFATQPPLLWQRVTHGCRAAIKI